MKTILITGISGFIGSKIAERLKNQFRIVGIDTVEPCHSNYDSFYPIDLLQTEALATVFHDETIDYTIHTAAQKSLQLCEQNKALAYELNYKSTMHLYALNKEAQAKFIFISSDQVFRGNKGYSDEETEVSPINYYGELKVLVERVLLKDVRAAICRTALVFGEIPPHQQRYFCEIKDQSVLVVQGYIVQHVLHHVLNKKVMRLADDEWITPTSVQTLAEQIEAVIKHDVNGIVHCCGGERISRYAFGLKILEMAGFSSEAVEAVKGNDPLRPKDVSMDFSKSAKKLQMDYPTLEEMLAPIIHSIK